MNIDGIRELQQFTMEIGNQLVDLESMDPTSIIPKIQSITNSGMQTYIMDTIRTCIHHYQKDRLLIKYAYLIDKLLKLPVWNQLAQSVIVQFYCDIFIFLLLQKCYHQIDQLKILRKFWLKTIHPRHLQTMKDIIVVETGVDIDQYFKADLIATLKIHYEKKLKLTAEEMSFHLPKTIKVSNQIYEQKLLRTLQDQQQQSAIMMDKNANYIITQQPNMPNNPTHIPSFLMYNQNAIINPNLYPTTMRRSLSPEHIIIQQQQFHHYPQQLQNYDIYQQQSQVQPSASVPFRINTNNTTQRISPPIDPRRISQKRIPISQQPVLQQDPVPFYHDKIDLVNQNFKRERFFSQETRTSNIQQSLNNQSAQGYQKINLETEPQPQKKIHFNDVYEFLQKQPQKDEKGPQKQKYTRILEMLRNDTLYRCKQCGKGQKSTAEYEKHMSEHFEQKLEKREKKKHTLKLMSVDEWTNKSSSSSLQQFNQFYISIANLTSSREQNFTIQPLQFTCKLCSEPFDIKLIQDQWVLSNATFCLIDSVKLPLHKTCQQALDESSNSYF